ncbi:glycosyl hydrolase catalytic core-domain-containing protein [Coniochaeta sp. 2T2.1]|nr:glycosyl hydrolase catalytic core-domain-containing protein [Coniochaeta sp. 2T2.1]
MPFSRTFVSTIALLSTALIQGTEAAFPKRGLCSNDDIPITQFGGVTNNGRSSQVNWQYNWDSTTSQEQPWSEYVPMLWGLQDYHTGHWNDRASYWLSQGGSGHLLGFNEPDIPSQASLSVAQAVAGYRKYMKPFIGRASIGTPAVTNGGYDWLSQFLNQCTDCGIDFIAAHWYNDQSLFDDFKNWVNKLCTLGKGKQVWITEFQAYGTIDQQSAFLKKAIPFLDNNSCVFRYAYFGAADPSKIFLQNNVGPALSPLGVQYAFTPYGQAQKRDEIADGNRTAVEWTA